MISWKYGSVVLIIEINEKFCSNLSKVLMIFRQSLKVLKVLIDKLNAGGI